MRQALSVALIEYTGALVVISHDRHLLRSVCDELLIVHDGIVDRFKRSLDEYPAWLKERELAQSEADNATIETPPEQISKKQQRQVQAKRRQRLKPMYDRVRDVEKQLADSRVELATLEERLADPSIYTDHERKPELTRLVQDQAAKKAEIQALEWNWLEASEALEAAE
jgi:ATP-binding cassette subfamily F protein 3